MASFGNDIKYSVRYTASIVGDSATRTISGLNIGNNTETGPNIGVGITILINTLASFSNGTLGDIRSIQERTVTI